MPAALCWWLIVASLLVMSAGQPPQGASAEALMGAAQVLQEVEGRYADAIAAYRKVLAATGVTRAIAAQAQLMIGVCHERLGQKEARAAYQAVLTKYADQTEAAAEARKRLQALDGPPRSSGVTLKQVPLTVKADMIGPPSPDGRFIALREARSGNVFIEDLRTGATRRITNADPTTPEMNDTGILYAPDGNRIAYVWRSKNASQFELHVYDLKSSTDKVVHAHERLDVFGWSPDGESIVFLDYRNDGMMSALRLGDGSVRVLRNRPGREAYGSAAVAPDGRHLAFDVRIDGARGDDVLIQSVSGNEQTTIATGEGAKGFCGWSPDGKAVYFTNDQSGTVDLFRAPVANGQPAGAAVLVQRDLGPITPLGVVRDGTLFFARERRLNDVLVADFNLESGEVTSKAVHVDFSNPARTSAPAWSPDGRFLAYHCGLRSGADFQNFVDTLCIKSFVGGSVRKLKLEASIYSALRFVWCCEGKELHVKGVTSERKAVTWRFDPETGRVLGQVASKVADVRPTFDRTTRTARVTVVDASGRETEIYRGQEGERASVIAVSADSRWVALGSSPAKGVRGTRRVIVANHDGSGHKELLTLRWPLALADATFVPGADYLLCVVSTEDPWVDEVWKVPVDGSPYRKLDVGPGKFRSLAVRPGGEQLAFVSFQSDRPEVWTLENIAVAPRQKEQPLRDK